MTQIDIDVRVDGYDIMRLLVLYEAPLGLADFCQAGGMRGDRLDAALAWCFKLEYIERIGKKYGITRDGRDYCDDAKGNPHLTVAGHRSFVDESLTGLKQTLPKIRKGGDWQRSEITSAVLPKAGVDRGYGTEPERILMEIEHMRRAEKQTAVTLGITVDELRELVQADLVRICRGGGIEHVGRFHKGQTMCVECKRGRRK